jgi:hypothetical protein
MYAHSKREFFAWLVLITGIVLVPVGIFVGAIYLIYLVVKFW